MRDGNDLGKAGDRAGSQEDPASGEAARRSTTALQADPAPKSLSLSTRPQTRVSAPGALQTVLPAEEKVAGGLMTAHSGLMGTVLRHRWDYTTPLPGDGQTQD